ncbi:hypothetical protein QTP88_002457 [Uroleucon formosanum]
MTLICRFPRYRLHPVHCSRHALGWIPINYIRIAADNDRYVFDPSELGEASESGKKNGAPRAGAGPERKTFGSTWLACPSTKSRNPRAVPES